MTSNWLVPAESTTLLATFLLLVIFIAVHRKRPTGFSAVWILGWGAYVIRLIFGILNGIFGPSVLMTIAYMEFTGLSALILFRAALKISNPARFRVYGGVAFALVSTWIVYSVYFVKDTFWVSLPTFFFFGAVQLLTGYYFLRANRAFRHVGGYVTGWGFIIWGIHKFDYPFLRPVAWFAPVGYLIGAFLTVIVGIGILMLMFEQSEEREKELAAALGRDKNALQKSEERFKLAMEASRDGIWDWDIPTGNVYYSPSYFAMLGYDGSEFPRRADTWLNLIHPEDKDKVLAANNACIENACERFQVEFRMKASDGSWKWILGQGKAVERGAQMRALRMTGTHTNITERKRADEEIRQLNAGLEQRVEERTRELREAQEQLVEKEKLAVLGQLADGVGHELRNPLGVISNAVYFLKMAQPDANEKIREYLDLIEKHVRISDKIVTDLLSFTQIKPAKPEPVSIPETVKQALEYFPVPEGVRITLDLPADELRAHADPQHASQILGNLILNACHAMEAKGGDLVVSGSAEKGMVRVSVRDSGGGIPPENMEKIFEPLFTTKLKGIGLGLTISKKLVEVNNGRIEVESKPGEGSAFTIWLPVRDKS